jgi:hypothetical protein
MSSTKTSTAALDSVRRRLGSDSRGIPGHLSGARRMDVVRSKESLRGCESERFLDSFGMTEGMAGGRICLEDAMNSRVPGSEARDLRAILPVMLRVAFSLMLWTLGGTAMNLAAEPAKEHRVVYPFAVQRGHGEDLQRWVNAGHEAWCRDPQLVAAASLRRIADEFEEVEAASLPLELEYRQKSEAVYTLHSLDGRVTYRITLRRYDWLLARRARCTG